MLVGTRERETGRLWRRAIWQVGPVVKELIRVEDGSASGCASKPHGAGCELPVRWPQLRKVAPLPLHGVEIAIEATKAGQSGRRSVEVSGGGGKRHATQAAGS